MRMFVQSRSLPNFNLTTETAPQSIRFYRGWIIHKQDISSQNLSPIVHSSALIGHSIDNISIWNVAQDGDEIYVAMGAPSLNARGITTMVLPKKVKSMISIWDYPKLIKLKGVPDLTVSFAK